MESAEPASRPGWLDAGAAGQAQPNAAEAAPRYQRQRAYAEWYAWAGSQVGDRQRSHAAAAAAMHGIESSQPQPAVIEVATHVLHGAPSIAPEADPQTRAYAGWFAWANLEMKLDKTRAHLAAQAATGAQEQGLSAAQAAGAAMRAAGLPAGPAPDVSARIRNGALLNLAWGVGCLVIPFVFNFFLPVAPVIGLLWGARVLRVSRHWLVIVAVIVNVLALILNVVILIGGRLLR